MSLTISLQHAAEILGVTPTNLRAEIKKKKIIALRVGGQMRVSVFVLAKLLGTSPFALLDYLEDETLARLMDEAEQGEMFTREEALARYKMYIEKAA